MNIEATPVQVIEATDWTADEVGRFIVAVGTAIGEFVAGASD